MSRAVETDSVPPQKIESGSPVADTSPDASTETPPGTEADYSFRRLMQLCMSTRILVDTGTQIFNPYLPIIAAGLGTNVVVVGRLVSLRSATGLIAPLIGSLADRYGYRLIMRTSLVLMGIGSLWLAMSSGPLMAVPAMILTGVGTAGFVPTLQAYLSARLPYAQRARGMGILEYSWAFTGIVGLFAAGQLIASAGWRAPFIILGIGMLIMSIIFRALPQARDASPPRPRTDHRPGQTFGWSRMTSQVTGFFALGERANSAYSAILASSLNFFAAIQIMITHGAWLNEEYGLGAAQLGTVALLFGIFDLGASVSVSIFTDQFGKKRSVLLGTIGTLIGYILLPFLNVSLVSAVLGIALARGFFEFAIVSNLPLLSEQVPEQRGKVMTLGTAGVLAASTIATFIAPSLYKTYGVFGVASFSTVAALLSLIILITRVHEYDDGL